jgi:hypothetical protein
MGAFVRLGTEFRLLRRRPSGRGIPTKDISGQELRGQELVRVGGLRRCQSISRSFRALRIMGGHSGREC